MTAAILGGSAARRVVLMVLLLVLLYVFLYAPILYVIYTSFSEDIVWPFPPTFTLQAYADVFDSSLYADGAAEQHLHRAWQRRCFRRCSRRAARSACCATRRDGDGWCCSSSWRRSSWRNC